MYKLGRLAIRLGLLSGRPMQNELLMLPVAIHALRASAGSRVAKCWLACVIALAFLDLVGRSSVYKAILIVTLGGADGRVAEQVVDWVGDQLHAWGAKQWCAWLRAWCWLGPLWIIHTAKRIYTPTVPAGSRAHPLISHEAKNSL